MQQPDSIAISERARALIYSALMQAVEQIQKTEPDVPMVCRITELTDAVEESVQKACGELIERGQRAEAALARVRACATEVLGPEDEDTE